MLSQSHRQDIVRSHIPAWRRRPHGKPPAWDRMARTRGLPLMAQGKLLAWDRMARTRGLPIMAQGKLLASVCTNPVMPLECRRLAQARSLTRDRMDRHMPVFTAGLINLQVSHP